jgi:hypothetical protein
MPMAMMANALARAETASVATAPARPPVQAKLRVGPVDDPLEREADRVADAVVAGRPTGTIGALPPDTAQRKCAECDAEEEKPVQRKCAGCAAEERNHERSAVLAENALSRGGEPLTAEQRAYFEPRFARDFSDVRIHADGKAAEAARTIDALAYTAGRDIAFGAGQYRPQTPEGRRLLAHELTHVVHQTAGAQSVPTLQRKGQGAAAPTPSFPSSVTFPRCDETPGRLDFVRQSAINAFLQVSEGDCIKNESLKRDFLASFEGLTLACDPETIAGRCAEKKISARTIILSGLAFGGLPYCPSELAATIFHEVMHLAEGWNLFHGNLSYDCGEACFPGSDELKRGDASRCGNESGLAPFAGVSAGAAFPGKGSPTGYARLYVGVEKRGPILSIFRPALGIGLSIIGEPTGAEPGDASPGTSTLLSLMGALRFDPGKDGGVYFSIGGGSGLVFGSGGVHRGYEVGAKLGYRWHIYDISLDAGMNYDPTRDAGQEKLYTVGATFQLAPKIR